MSFKIFNTNVEENEKINDTNTKVGQLFSGFMMLQGAIEELGGGGGSGVRTIYTLDGGVGGADVTSQPTGTVIYSLNQNPGQIIIDGNITPKEVGTEYIIYAGSNNTVYLQNQKTSGRIQISGTATNTSNANVNLPINSKCTVTKLTQTLWVVQGDGLTYAT